MRSLGTIVGIEDGDQEMWPNSKWKCFKVQWDESSALVRPERVSPWKIELFAASSPLQSRPKSVHNIKFLFQTRPHVSGKDYGSVNGSEYDGVLQGQEKRASVLKLNNKPTERENIHKVMPPTWKHHLLYPDDGNRPNVDCQEQVGLGNWSNHLSHEPAFCLNLGLKNISPFTNGGVVDADPDDTAACPPYSDLDVPPFSPDLHEFKRQKIPMDRPSGGMCKIFGVNVVSNPKGTKLAPDVLLTKSSEIVPSATTQSVVCDSDQFSAVKKPSGSSESDNPTALSRKARAVSTRTGVKVHKQGTALGRSIDLSKFDGYGPLVLELDSLFEFEGSLSGRSKGWHITCMGKDQDILTIGDYPWREFCRMVKKIFICRQEESQRIGT